MFLSELVDCISLTFTIGIKGNFTRVLALDDFHLSTNGDVRTEAGSDRFNDIGSRGRNHHNEMPLFLVHVDQINSFLVHKRVNDGVQSLAHN